MTPAEAFLWKALKNRRLGGRRFRRQYSIGPFIVDFYCPDDQALIRAVEVDGQVHLDPMRRDYDDRRERFLRAQGLHILRFENRDVFVQPEEVLQAIIHAFDS